MLHNDSNDFDGMLSRAGRSSAEKYNIILRKDEILAGGKKKIFLRDIFSPDEINKHDDSVEDNIDIFKADFREATANTMLNSVLARSKEHHYIQQSPNNQKISDTRGKYQRLHDKEMQACNKKKRFMGPSCTKYNPKMKLIWKSTITGPEWFKVSGRKSPVRKIDQTDFYLTHPDFHVTGNSFINMAKQSQRREFGISHDVRIRSIKTSDSLGTRKHLKLEAKRDRENEREGFTTNYNINQSTQESMNEAYQGIMTSHIGKFNEDEFPAMKSSKMKPPKFSKSSEKGLTRKVKIQAPDFKKVISREQLDKIYGDKRTIIPFSIPNFSQTRERPIMMVKYDTMTHNNSNPKSIQLSPDISISFDPHKVLDKVNNHKKSTVPNFKLMTSRPNDDDPLPAYMKQLHSRGGAELFTDKTLKMNNYSEGKFISTETSFWPKKSFNKIINLNLLNSEKFLTSMGLKREKTQKTEGDENNGMSESVIKSMRFYKKNFDDLMKESMLNKFDNVTFKTIKHASRLDTGDVDKFLLNFERVDS